MFLDRITGSTGLTRSFDPAGSRAKYCNQIAEANIAKEYYSCDIFQQVVPKSRPGGRSYREQHSRLQLRPFSYIIKIDITSQDYYLIFNIWPRNYFPFASGIRIGGAMSFRL